MGICGFVPTCVPMACKTNQNENHAELDESDEETLRDDDEKKSKGFTLVVQRGSARVLFALFQNHFFNTTRAVPVTEIATNGSGDRVPYRPCSQSRK